MRIPSFPLLLLYCASAEMPNSAFFWPNDYRVPSTAGQETFQWTIHILPAPQIDLMAWTFFMRFHIHIVQKWATSSVSKVTFFLNTTNRILVPFSSMSLSSSLSLSRCLIPLWLWLVSRKRDSQEWWQRDFGGRRHSSNRGFQLWNHGAACLWRIWNVCDAHWQLDSHLGVQLIMRAHISLTSELILMGKWLVREIGLDCINCAAMRSWMSLNGLGRK